MSVKPRILAVAVVVLSASTVLAQGWHEWLRPGDTFIGLSDFGASAPAADAFRHFGLTPARVAEAAHRLISR